MPVLSAHSLADLPRGRRALIERLDLPEGDARRLMELGFLPGSSVELSRRSPFGDPSVFRIDDAEIALRRETASRIVLRSEP